MFNNKIIRNFLTVFIVSILSSFSAIAEVDKVKIAVGEIEYRAKDSSENKMYSAYGRGVREDTRAFVDMLTTALVKSRKFDVIERDKMSEILKEQGMSIEGFMQGGYEGDNFNLQGVDYILTGSITEYGEQEKAIGISGFSSSSRIATMAVDVRILNVSTGTIEIAETVRAEQTGGSSINVKGFASGDNDSSGALLGQVMRETSTNVATLVVSASYPIKVVAITKKGDIMLNYGKGLLSKGDVLDIFSQGETFIDPDTGEVLGSEEELVASIQVTSAQQKFSKAKLLESNSDTKLESGMIARINKTEKKKESKKKTLW